MRTGRDDGLFSIPPVRMRRPGPCQLLMGPQWLIEASSSDPESIFQAVFLPRAVGAQMEDPDTEGSAQGGEGSA